MTKITKLICALAIASLCQGAVVTVCSSGCTTASLQVALDTLSNCGDTIRIKSTEVQSGNFTIKGRTCTGANPITITSDRAAWLPPAGGRITPSHLANLAVLSTPNSDPALAAVLTSGVPARGWVFRGIAFTSSAAGPTFALVALNNYSAASQAQLASDIIFDQAYFFRALPNAQAKTTQNQIRADGVNIEIKNSFFGDGFWGGIESHGIAILTTPGPVTVTNNFVTTSSIPIFSGGAETSYPAYLENGITARYNYTWRPWKWNSDPKQPYATDYEANSQGALSQGPLTITGLSDTGLVTMSGSPYLGEPGAGPGVLNIASVGGCIEANATNWRYSVDTLFTTIQLLDFPGCASPYTSGGTINVYALQPCLKNHGEFKWGQNILWEYNVGENSWRNSSCGSQFTGFTGTLRTTWDSSINSGTLDQFTFTDTDDLTWAGSYRIGETGTGACCNGVSDLGVCISMPATGTECHPVASYTGASLHTSEPFSAAPGSTYNGWIVYTANASLSNMTVRNNVFKNTDAGFSTLALSFGNLGMGNAGRGTGNHFLNNLFVTTSPYLAGYTALSISAGEADYAVNPSEYRWEHNTFYTPFGRQGPYLYFGATECTGCATSIQPKFESSAISDNLFGTATAGVKFGGDSWVDICGAGNFYMTNSAVRNNVLPGASVGTGCASGNTVSGNIVGGWANPYGGMERRGVFKVVPGASYSGVATDGTDSGVDYDQLPLITGLRTTVGTTAALLEFDLAAPNRDAGSTQPCALEVSSSRNLHSDLSTYSVIHDLNPIYFQQADSSARNNALLPGVVVNGGHVFWPLGGNFIVTGDDGNSHDLGLAPATTYYGRLMCYGDTQLFSFQTSKATGALVRYPAKVVMQIGADAGATTVRLRYGSTVGVSSQEDFAVGGDGRANVSVPLVNGEPTYYRVEFLTGTTVTYVGPTEVILGGA